MSDCPMCGSEDFVVVCTEFESLGIGTMKMDKYHCGKCRFVSRQVELVKN